MTILMELTLPASEMGRDAQRFGSSFDLSRACCEVLLLVTGEDICEAVYEANVCEAVVIGAGGAATLALTPAVLATLGFTSAGIAAGSIAAKLMSFCAILNGGGVAAGGVVSILQSIGAAGLSWISGAVVGGGGVTLGWVLSAICNQTRTD